MKRKISIGRMCAAALLAVSMVLAGCAADVDEKNSYSAAGYGSLTIESGSRALAVSDITNAKVSVSGYKMETCSADAAVSDGSGSITVDKIPAGKKRVVTVQAFGGTKKLDGVIIRAVADIVAGKNTSVHVDWESSKKGAVYNALLESGVDIGALDDAAVQKIEGAIPDVNASLINAEKLAKDFDGGNGTLKSSSEYKLSTGTVNVTVNGYNGCTVQITDPTSAVSGVIASDSETVPITNVAPGTWNIYVLDGTTKKYTRSITISDRRGGGK